MDLCKPAWRSKNEKKAITAIEKIEDQELRNIAIDKITDESLLAKLILVFGDSSLLPRITQPELLLNIALNAKTRLSATAFSKLKVAVHPAELLTMLTVKTRNNNEKNMVALLQMLKTIEPERWKEYCDLNTIDALMDLRHWGELAEISCLLWDFYADDTFREVVNQAEDNYQKQRLQWEGEYNHIIEMLFYQVKEKQNLQAAEYIKKIYQSGLYGAYIEKNNLAYKEDEHTDKNVAAEYYVPLGPLRSNLPSMRWVRTDMVDSRNQ